MIWKYVFILDIWSALLLRKFAWICFPSQQDWYKRSYWHSSAHELSICLGRGPPEIQLRRAGVHFHMSCVKISDINEASLESHYKNRCWRFWGATGWYMFRFPCQVGRHDFSRAHCFALSGRKAFSRDTSGFNGRPLCDHSWESHDSRIRRYGCF